MTGRIGVFFLLLGFLGLVISWTSYQTGEGLFWLGVGSIACIVLGLYLGWRGRKPKSEVERFRAYKKMRSKRAYKQAEKKRKKREQRQREIQPEETEYL